jgi:simple sugar transport system ATP-binding protein
VLDNFILGQEGGLLQDRRRAARDLRHLCDQFGFDLDPDAFVHKLTVGERQQLEIVRLLSRGVSVLILDEPTTGISTPQRIKLFDTLRLLADQGKTIILVSHKLEEIQELCSQVTVLRRGRVAGQVTTPCSTDTLVRLMFGQSLAAPGTKAIPLGSPVLRLTDVTVVDSRLHVQGLSLDVRAGEVIGLAGLEGSGQDTFLQVCAGLRRPSRGQIIIRERDMTGRPYHDFLRAGVAYLPAGRLEEGLISGLTIAEHVVLAEHRPDFFINWAQARSQAEARIAAFHIVGQPHTPVDNLSGGNQQRTMLALLPPHLSVLLLDRPTRGLDIESTLWVWDHLKERRRQGTAIIFTSADLDEIIEQSDRILVFSGGRVTRALGAREVSAERLGEYIGGKGL